MKILYGTDFKESSRHAAEVAKKLIQVYKNTDFISMHIIASFWKDWLSSGAYEKEAQERLLLWHKDITGSEDSGQSMVIKGSPAMAVLDAVSELKPDLLIVGGGDAGAKKQWITGTTAEAIVREAECSSLLVKKDTLKRFLVAIDFGEQCLVALKGAAELAKQVGAELVAIHAVPAPDENTLGMKENTIREHEEKFKQEHNQKLDEFLTQVDTSGLKMKKELHWGLPHDVVIDYALDHDVDLIVIGQSRKSKVRQSLLGSTSSRILRYAPASLYVVRA